MMMSASPGRGGGDGATYGPRPPSLSPPRAREAR
jgi:hypothetical protein